MVKNEIKKKIINWWNNGEQDKPLVNATIHNSNLPNIADINHYWDKNKIRWYGRMGRCMGTRFNLSNSR